MKPHKLNVHVSRIRTTPAAEQLLKKHDESAGTYIQRHLQGDWGDCDPEDIEANEHAVEVGTRTLGVYELGTSRLWVIADAHLSNDHYVQLEGRMFMPRERYALTVMVPDDY